MELGELQRLMERTYGERDRARGIPVTVAWLADSVAIIPPGLPLP